MVLDSNFDSGNMGKATKVNPYQYSLWTASDCEGTDREGYPKSWFYFSVTGFQNSKVTFNIHRIHVLWALVMNILFSLKLLKNTDLSIDSIKGLGDVSNNK